MRKKSGTKTNSQVLSIVASAYIMLRARTAASYGSCAEVPQAAKSATACQVKKADFTFNPKMNCSLVFDLATGALINKREDALFLGPGGTGKSHLTQAIGQCAIQQGYEVLYRERHTLL